MDIFTQKKLLVRIVIVLAALNLLSIGFFVCKVLMPPPRPATEAPAEARDVSAILEKELDLTSGQVDRIKSLRTDFAEKEKRLVIEIQADRDSMNKEIFNKVTHEEVVRSLAGKISENEYKMEMLRFEQATELKSICTPDQVDRFEKLVRDMRDFFKPR